MLIYAGGLAVFFPLFIAIAMTVSGFIGFAVSVIFPLVVFTLVVPAILPTLLIVLIAVKTAFILIVMVLGYRFIVAFLSHSGNCSETTDCHNERKRS